MQPGDIAFSRGTSLLSALIRGLTQSDFSHVKIIISADGQVVEAVPPRLRLGTVSPDDTVVSIAYHDEDDRERAVRIALSAVGRRYSYVACLSDGLNRLGFRFTVDQVDALNCAEVAALCLGAGLDVRGMDPGSLYRLISAPDWRP